MPDQPTQSQLDAEALARTLRIGRQMMAMSDALFSPATSNPDVPHPMDPDYSREGLFVYHNCWRCKNGAKPCPDGQTGPTRNCEYPHARDD